MSKTIINADAKYLLRGDIAENWEKKKPILYAREPGLVLDKSGHTVGFKIGNGETTWNNLPMHYIRETEKEYNPESENPQSGIAVAEAVKTKQNKFADVTEDENERHVDFKHNSGVIKNSLGGLKFEGKVLNLDPENKSIFVNNSKIESLASPEHEDDAATKGYVDKEIEKIGGGGTGGKDGVSPTVEVTETANGHNVSITDVNGTKSFEVQNGKDGKDGSDGADGKDGVSATHSWNGTTLTVTSASGTSSANLKGEKGDKGEQGEQGVQGIQGEKGADGYTPIKGVDYYTEEDKAEIVAQLSQIEAPKIVSSIEEMTDTTKHYVLDGYIYYNKTVVIEGTTTRTYPNQFVSSTAQLNKRLSGSSGSASAKDGYFVTDFIAVPNFASETPYNVRLNWEMTGASPADDVKVLFYKADKTTKLGYEVLATSGYSNNNIKIENGKTIIDLKTYPKNTAPTATEVAYIKLQLSLNSSLSALTSADIANLEITLDAVYEETTTEPTIKNEWVNSGISYAPTFKTDLIGVLGEDNVIYLSDNLPSGIYILKYGDETYDIVGTITV